MTLPLAKPFGTRTGCWQAVTNVKAYPMNQALGRTSAIVVTATHLSEAALSSNAHQATSAWQYRPQITKPKCSGTLQYPFCPFSFVTRPKSLGDAARQTMCRSGEDLCAQDLQRRNADLLSNHLTCSPMRETK